ncbi:SEC-C metal-binding domain-containing protein [Rhodanobacter sp. T12-5]|uniref:CopG family ribbon-helix-helix protein n=1 Tax=Rhodanobacter sp. T12-5 TaxID=2024611 RepID=UPI0011EEB292|nr:SEC-C metal-binding domain-containing protein [Rhodanobacter sp. T12-5]KAA0068957.1 hypothetical protein CIW53_12425 [Rhodanobacter sp. T12-5]KAA0068960.1 hypothetical protein CIW53_12440 [Rhodanobacter sp. T12-5]
MTTSTTLRLPDGLKADAEAYAVALGISLNALCAVALRDYLDARSRSEALPVVNLSPAEVRQKYVQDLAPAALPYVQPAGGVYAPCPCGSGQKWKWCHGKPGA